MAQSVADGQLPTGSAALYTVPTAPPQLSYQATINCFNTSATITQTVVITVTRAGSGNTRNVHRAVLAPNEKLVVQGIPVATGDSINGYTTTVATVDYVVTTAATDVPLTGTSFDANGAIKQVNTGVSGNQTVGGVVSATGYTEVPTALTGSADAPSPHTSHTYLVTTAGVDAMTLAAPTAGTDDGVCITVTSNTAYAHTITATGLLQTGAAAVNTVTFAAHPGASVTLSAYQGKWCVQASTACTFS